MDQHPLYQPLEGNKSIRFFRLLAGKATDTLLVELVYKDLENAYKAYEATSYSWGSWPGQHEDNFMQ